MIRAVRSPAASALTKRVVNVGVRNKSSSPPASGGGVLDGDAGSIATHMHHHMTTFLAVATPVVFLMPDSWSDGIVNKVFGAVVAVNVSAHSWIGLNYVATDYVPKISKGLVGPARIVNAGIGAVTLVGLGIMAFNNKGGVKGAIKGLWTGKKEEKKE